MERIKVMIVDDHKLFRQGLCSMLESEEGIEVVGSFGDANSVLENHNEVNPDIILMDIKMPDMNGFELSSSLKAQNPDYKIILLSMEINHSYIKRAMSEKSNGYIPKDSNIEIVLEAIKSVTEGKVYYDGKIKEYVFHLMMGDSKMENDPLLDNLSEREISVLRLITDGKQNKIIAELLFISVKTVDTHRNNILKKLGMHSTADLVKFAVARKLTINPYEN